MLTNGQFKGVINGKELRDYKKLINWNITDERKRLELINNIFNLDAIGSQDTYWQDIWDCGICKSNLNTTDARWEETNIANFLETVGTYFIYGYDKKEKKRKKELELFDTMTQEDVSNDKNYRLAPPDRIIKSDFKMRELFAGTYEEYVEKVSKTIYEVKSRDSWERIKHNEEEKIKLLTDAQRNLDILNKQMKDFKEGIKLQYNKIEEMFYNGRTRGTNVTLYHLRNNIRDVKDYMIMCKLAYTNRVMVKPDKCKTSYNILERVDYLDPTHIRAMLSLGRMKLDPSKDISIIAYDINKKIKDMYSNGELSDRDMYIIEGLQYNVPYETLAKELGIKLQNVEKAITRMCNNIVKSFYNDHMDLYFLNESRGKYKTCSRCGETKLINRFDKDKTGKYGVRGYCKDCYSRKK